MFIEPANQLVDDTPPLQQLLSVLSLKLLGHVVQLRNMYPCAVDKYPIIFGNYSRIREMMSRNTR